MDGNITGSLLLLSRTRRHKTYVGAGYKFNCHPFGDVYKNEEEACRFVKTTESCNIIVNLVDYLDLMVCDFDLHDNFFGMLTCTFAVISFYCLVLVVTGKYFIVPNILTMARTTHMSGYTFGYMVLAAIIVLPICVEISVTCKGHFAFSALLVADWLASVLPLLTAGFLIIASPREVTFHVRPILFCWNMFMMLFGLVTLFHVLPPGNVVHKSFNDYFYTVLFATIYIGYLIFLMKYQSRARAKNPKRRDPSIASDEYETQPSADPIDGDAWKVFLETISPYKNNVGNFCYIVTITPIWFVLSFFIPVVTKNRHLNGWCKIFTMINFLVFPMLLYSSPSDTLFYCIVFLCLLAIVLIAALTYVQRVPPFHKYLAIFGNIAGVYVFLGVDNELSCLFWQVLNYMVDWRADAVFLVSPVGILINVAILSQALVNKGFTDMAYGMVFGSITLTIYATYPVIAFNICVVREHMTPITSNIQTTYHYLMITLLILFVSVCCANFQIRKCHSYFLCIMYAIYYIFVFLSAVQLIHPLGSQHSINWEEYKGHAEWA